MSILQLGYTYPSGQQLEIVQGDITGEAVDAIVNAANSHLQHGAGVAGAIVRRGGLQIQQESTEWVRQHGTVSHAEPAYTSAGKLPCRYVIHAVGPVWGEGDEDAKLSSAIRGSLQVADRLKLASIAFPAISTGIFGFPKERAARIFLETLQNYFSANPSSGLKLVRLTLYDRTSLTTFLDEAVKLGIPPASA
jgi:O-acetyl-ADP-ribose deacetylase (regulator of RNase III)